MSLTIIPTVPKHYIVSQADETSKEGRSYSFTVDDAIDYMPTIVLKFTDNLFVLIFDNDSDIRMDLYQLEDKEFVCIDTLWTPKRGAK